MSFNEVENETLSMLGKRVDELGIENIELKQQIANIKYLDEKEVEKICNEWKVVIQATENKLQEYFDCEDEITQEDLKKLFISEICKLSRNSS